MKTYAKRSFYTALSVVIISSAVVTAGAGRYNGYGYGGFGGYGYGGLGNTYEFDRADNQLKAKQKELADLRASKAELERLEGEIADKRKDLAKQNEILKAYREQLTEALRNGQETRHIMAVIELEKATAMKLEQDIAHFEGLASRNGKNNWFQAEIERQEKIMPELEKQVIMTASGRREVTAGELVKRGIAGEEFCYFDYGRCDSLWDGLKQGFILGTAKEFGDFVRTKMRGVFQDKLGSLFDSTVNGISDGFKRMQEIIFHDSKRPFEEAELMAWQNHITGIFDDIERVTKEGLRDALRSQDSTMRQVPGSDIFDDLAEALPGKEKNGSINKPLHVWADLFGGYVLQFSYYILVLQDRKGYYKIDSFEVFFASHIEERLKQFCELLVRVNDLADIEANLGVHKAAIPAFKSNLSSLFKQLQQTIKPRSVSAATTTNTSQYSYEREKPSTRSSYEYDDYKSGYPQSGWGR